MALEARGVSAAKGRRCAEKPSRKAALAEKALLRSMQTRRIHYGNYTKYNVAAGSNVQEGVHALKGYFFIKQRCFLLNKQNSLNKERGVGAF